MIRYTISREQRGGLWQVNDGLNEPVVVDSPTLLAFIEDQLRQASYLVVAVPAKIR
jgi:hypothetical protein